MHTTRPRPIRIFGVDVNILPPEYYITKEIRVRLECCSRYIIIRRSYTDVFRDFYDLRHRNRIVCVRIYDLQCDAHATVLRATAPRGEIVTYSPVRLLLLLLHLFFIPV